MKLMQSKMKITKFESVCERGYLQNYVNLIKKDKNGNVVEEGYCLIKCKVISHLKNRGYIEGEKYYSLRYADLQNSIPFRNQCCYDRPFDNQYLFAILLILELTYEYFPSIFLLAFVLFLYEYFKREDLKAFSEDFLNKDYDIKKVNIIGVLLILVVVSYNLWYMSALNTRSY